MNQVNPNTAFDPAKPDLPLGETEVGTLRMMLTQGDKALAKQQDIIELHKRIVTMFTTLNTGLAEKQTQKASEDREILTAKLEDMRLAVNGMEAAFRIEMAPIIEKIVKESLADQPVSKKNAFSTIFVMVIAVLIGISIGTVQSNYFNEVFMKVTQIIGL